MSKSMINQVIVREGLKPGDTMRNVKGEDIEGSVVLGSYSFIHRDDGHHGGYRLESERPIHGDAQSLWLSKDAMRVLKGIEID